MVIRQVPRSLLANSITGFPTGWEEPTKENIWFEPHAGKFGSFAKDKVELLLWRKVCMDKTMTLHRARTEYLKRWTKLLAQH